MKKIIACISLIFALSASVTAMAENAQHVVGDNSTTIDASGYSTVLIQNDETGKIVYANQKDSGFDAAAKFFLQDNPADGKYTVTMGGNVSGKPRTLALIIGETLEPVIIPATIMGKEYSEDGNTYDMGCKIENIQASQCKYIVMTSTRGNATKTMCIEPSTAFTGDGGINIGIRINNIQNGVDVTVGVSNTDVADV